MGRDRGVVSPIFQERIVLVPCRFYGNKDLEDYCNIRVMVGWVKRLGPQASLDANEVDDLVEKIKNCLHWEEAKEIFDSNLKDFVKWE